MPGTACFSVALLLCRLGYPEKIKPWTVEPALEFLRRGQREPGDGELCQVGRRMVEAPGDDMQRMLGTKLFTAATAAQLEPGAQNSRGESRSFALH